MKKYLVLLLLMTVMKLFSMEEEKTIKLCFSNDQNETTTEYSLKKSTFDVFETLKKCADCDEPSNQEVNVIPLNHVSSRTFFAVQTLLHGAEKNPALLGKEVGKQNNEQLCKFFNAADFLECKPLFDA